MTEDEFLESVLDRIEEQEARLLVWGITDASISKAELVDAINPLIEVALEQQFEGFIEVDEVIRALVERGLLFRVSANFGVDEGYRSRMSETVRLLFYLRQLFPKHVGRDGWQQGRTLVSDFRFSRRRRKYPKRDLNTAEVAEKITKGLSSRPFARALRTIICSRDEGFSLAEFQARATERIVASLEKRRSSGTLVSAGTGSGKTLAFYIPALARIAEHLLKDSRQSRNWVKCLALYPRTELLKDQFSEIYSEARRLDALTLQNHRKIRIGAFFGATPFNAQTLLVRKVDGWKRKGNGFRCGFMSCATPGCDGDLVWPETEIKKGREILVCDECSFEISDDEITLTRQSLQRDPPDILFTTTEMLNQRMSDSWSRHLFGIRPQASRAPEMMLLDEVHTYSGFHGAQVAYLLRRWAHLVRAPITFVGLSATLRDGSRFFSRLTGLYESQVQEVAPKGSDMTSEGAEYLLALKGDPVSKTSLLSTTIQTIMLLSRMLDEPTFPLSNGLFGKRLFAFTDDIDVINRLFFGLLDAEGRSSSGNPDMVRHPNGGLAHLRQPIPSRSREQYGQNWSAPVEIGHDLSERKAIGRTSSQDPGVISNLDIVVATASLEVGFNDPSVGAVVQHKAPRGVAAFLQRKGRAGRSRKMRPWTVLVLSDYGRDRQAYQAYDHLFDPELEVQALPLDSRYIQHIQAVYALIDYLGNKLSQSAPKGSVWADLATPFDPTKRSRQDQICKILSEILENEGENASLQEHLNRSLRIEGTNSDAVLWEHPRPLLTTVIPTAIRRLNTNWRRYGVEKEDFNIPNSPLPEFAPATLFSDLNLPEVRINLPPDWQDSQEREPEAMPISQAMRTFAAGRVSRRFGVRHALIRHWIAPEELREEASQDLPLEERFSGDMLGEWQIFDGNSVVSLPVLRPYEVNPTQPPRAVRDTSNARLVWHSQVVRRSPGNSLTPPEKAMWGKIILGIDTHIHGQQNPIEMRRFAVASRADIQREGQEGLQTRFDFQLDSKPASIGYSLSVDALRFSVVVPKDFFKNATGDTPEKWRALRAARYHSLIWEGDTLTGVQSPFLRQWLGSIFFSSLTYEAINRGISISEAATNLESGQASISLPEVLESIFQSPAIAEDEEAADTETANDRDRLRAELEMLLRDREVLKGLQSTAEVLWLPIDGSWQDWLAKRYKTTVAAAAYTAIGSLCPDMEADGLVVDVNPGPRAPDDLEPGSDPTQEVWISETAPGGTGHIQEFILRYAEDPRRFFSLLTASLYQSERQLVDFQLHALLESINGADACTDLIEVITAFRDAKSSQETEERFAQLRRSLRSKGFLLFHGFTTALSNRILRAGSSVESDKFLYQVVSFWDSEEQRLGVELDPRTIAFNFSQDNRIDSMLLNAGFTLPDNSRENWRFNVIYGMLWPRGSINRRQGMDLYNPFSDLPDAEPLLVTENLTNQAETISVDSADWKVRAINALSRSGIVTLAGETKDSRQLAEAVNFFAVNPIPSEYLSVFARLEAVRRTGNIIEVDLELAEVAQ